MTSNVFAGSFGLGVTGSMAAIQAEGTETEGTAADTSDRTHTAQNTVIIGSVFAEYTFDGLGGITLGYDMIPGSADVNSDVTKVTRIQTSVDGTAAEVTTSETRTAQAEVDGVHTIYLDIPVTGGWYGKLGYTEMDITTQEAFSGDGGSYGNASVDGIVYGAGFKGEMGSSGFYKIETTMTEFDSLTLTETGQTTDSPANKITADLDVTKATIALGFSF
jgi:hypothetical protein